MNSLHKFCPTTKIKMAAAAATPLAPSFNLYSRKHLIKHKTSRLKLKLSSNLNRQPLSRLPTSVPQPISVKGSRALAASRILTGAYVSGPAFDAIVSEVDPKIDGAEVVELQPLDVISGGLLWKLVSRHKWRVLASVLTLSGCTTCTLAMPLFSGKFFEVLIGARPDPIWQLLSKVGLLYTLEPIFTIIFVVNMNGIWEKVMSSLRAQIFQRVLIQKVEFFDKYKVGELTSLLTSDLGSLKTIVSDNVSRDRGFRAISEASYSTLCKSHWDTLCTFYSFTPAGASFGPPYANRVCSSRPICNLRFCGIQLTSMCSVAAYKRTTVSVFKSHGSVQATIADCVTETFAAIRTVRSFGGEKRQISVFSRQILDYERSGMTLGVFKSINESITRVAVYVSLMALYCLGGSKVKAGKLAVGTMVSFIGYTFTLTFAVQGVVNTFGDLRGAFAAVERINSVLSGAEIDEALAYALEKDLNRRKSHDPNLEPLLADSNGKMQTSRVRYMSSLKSGSDVRQLAESGDIHLEDVHFSYPLRPDVEILQGLDLTLKCGTVTALVGSSGAGKSTVVQLLARYYEEPVLFSVSVGENIAYGLPDDNVSKDDVIKAAKAANAHEFIISLPQGYDTLVGERGGLLSGGQRQRIAIARALLKNAPILILDEATSALDTVSERLVQDALNRLMKGRTTLVIAHRLSTVQNADQIALCSDGKVSELGTHSELIGQKGLYASLVGSQRLAFE
ncbi:hypothetical protein SASPL_149700 [Salvia splendens]|uniref:ATP-binding cassette, subfamily B (MDR/TAP), member 1 n=1 Tax=Salvia splendens TaxID=180675 RepID=A0A8X8WDA7_SALSN|nr:hypothetical protein SASPL_149700 [Salvia splendens]